MQRTYEGISLVAAVYAPGRKRETIHYSQANRRLHTQMAMYFFCSEYTDLLEESRSGHRLPMDESVLVIDASPSLDWPKAIGVGQILHRVLWSLRLVRHGGPDYTALAELAQETLVSLAILRPSSHDPPLVGAS